MFKYIYIVLGIILFIVLIILFVKLATLGKHGVVIADKAAQMEPKLEYIQKKSEEYEEVSKSLEEYRQKYGPTIRSLFTVLLIYKSFKKNAKKDEKKNNKTSFKTFMKNFRLLTRPNSIESYKTIINLIKKNV